MILFKKFYGSFVFFVKRDLLGYHGLIKLTKE